MRRLLLLAGITVVSLFFVVSGRLPSFYLTYRNIELQLSHSSFAGVPNHVTNSSLQPNSTRHLKSGFRTGSAGNPKKDAHESGRNSIFTRSSKIFNTGARESGKNGTFERRRFFPVGSGAYLFIEMGAYRGGPRSFFVVGLGSKSVHDYAGASFKCEWKSSSSNQSVEGKTLKFMPEHFGYSRVYTAVVVNCSFDEDVGTASEGGELILHASPRSSFEKNTERIVALREHPGDYNASIFDPPYPFEYVHCGSPLFGDISPQRIREWLAYHANFFGPRSHFFFYDAGGIHLGVQRILQPWINAGRITIQNVQDQEQFDGYYHNQFLIVNDCLHKTRFLTNWTFFFDVDEYLYVPQNSSLQSVLAEHSGFTQIHIDQETMSSQLCLNNTKVNHSELWGFEKLVFKYTTKSGARTDRKYAVQPRYVYAGGVHFTEHLSGNTGLVDAGKLRYYHYHGVLSRRGEVCSEFVDPANSTDVSFEGESLKSDYSMRPLGALSRSSEIEQIGEQPFLI